MNTEVKSIPINQITVTNKNPRDSVHKKNGSLKELTQSIKTFGIRVPIHVRPIKDGFELIAGERRFYACKNLKMGYIPAIVETMDDIAAFETMMVENEERLDLTTAEDIKKIETLVGLHKGDVKAVACKLEMSEHHVRLRINAATKLSAKWRKAIVENESAMCLSVGHLDLIARLPEKIQDDILLNRMNVIIGYDKMMNIKKLDNWINEEYIHALDKASWDLMKKDGHLQSCDNCIERSDKKGQAELWDVETTKKKQVVFCLNNICWNKKTLRVLAERLIKYKKEHTDLGFIRTDGFHLETKERCEALGIDIQKVDHIFAHKKVARTYKGALPKFMLNGANAGTVIWIAPDKYKSGSTKKAKGTVKTMAERKKDLQGLRLKLLYIKLKEAVEKCILPADTSLEFAAAVAAVYGFDGSYYVQDKGTEDEQVTAFRKGKKLTFGHNWKDGQKWEVKLAQAVWLRARGAFAMKVPGNPNAQEAFKAEDDCKAIAKLINFDWDKAWKEACEEKKEPKSWKNLKADGTPK